MRDQAHDGASAPRSVDESFTPINPKEQPPKPGQAEDWMDDVQWTITTPEAETWPKLDCSPEMQTQLFDGVNLIQVRLLAFKCGIWSKDAQKAASALMSITKVAGVLTETLAALVMLSKLQAKKGANREGK